MDAQPTFDFDSHVEILPVSRARATDPATSEAAANAFPEIRGEQRISVLLAFDDLGEATDYRISVYLGINRTSAGKRRKELQEAGLIEETEKREQTDSSCTAVVWRCTERGHQVAAIIRERMSDEKA